MNDYIILLRGINVGGKNKIAMVDLKKCLEQLGFTDVMTYIASGNVIVKSPKKPTEIQDQIQKALLAQFHFDSELIRVLVLTATQLESVVNHKPPKFGEEPNKYHSDVIFLMDLNVIDTLTVFTPKEGVDLIYPGEGVIYFQRLSALRTKSRLNRIIGTSAYQYMTIRTWNTVIKLLKIVQNRHEQD